MANNKIIDMKKITLWYRFKKGEWEYNHYEEGWDHLAKPLQAMTRNTRWAKELAYLDNGEIKRINEV